MPFVMNSSHKERNVCAQGNWFFFKGKQIKNIASDSLAFFFTSNLAYEGLVRLPDAFEDPSYAASPEGKKDLAEAEEKGINARVAFLQSLVDNELNSLKRDMQKNNDQSDPRVHMSKGMIANLEELAEYKRKGNAAKEAQLSRIAELEKAIKA
jgi:hypothetical protein